MCNASLCLTLENHLDWQQEKHNEIHMDLVVVSHKKFLFGTIFRLADAFCYGLLSRITQIRRPLAGSEIAAPWIDVEPAAPRIACVYG